MNKSPVAILGSDGFIGYHIQQYLRNSDDYIAVPINRASFNSESLIQKLTGCKVIIHLAGINKGPENEVRQANVDIMNRLLQVATDYGFFPKIIFASSTQIYSESPYGSAKKEAASLLKQWSDKFHVPSVVLIIPNVFGEFCRPFYNSVVANFAYQLTHDQEPSIIVDKEIEFIYVKHLVDQIMTLVAAEFSGFQEIRVTGNAPITVSALLALLIRFRDLYIWKKILPKVSTTFERQLFSVFLSYIDYDGLTQKPEAKRDDRGELFELLKAQDNGQLFFSATKPGYTRGNHYHTKKIERFCVLHGTAKIRLRKIGTEKVITYEIIDGVPQWVDIPVFHTHAITNTGSDELLVAFWANEVFDPSNSDTFFEKVEDGA